jgi:1-acyl-sn-glycerol-3-phosphate acyltransferase
MPAAARWAGVCDPGGVRAGYAVVRFAVQILLRLFYARIEVVGRERIPSTGPLIVAANHHNAAVDAMLIIATFPRPIRVLAKAPLFANPIVGPFLRLMGGVPVHRRAEAGDDPRRNDALFAAASRALRQGGAILIFPEGTSTPRPTLLPLRTGAARILLGAELESGPLGTTLLPVGLVLDDAGTFREATGVVMIGGPVPVSDVLASGEENDFAVRLLTERLADAIRAQIVEAEDHYTLDLLRVVEQAWSQEKERSETSRPVTAVAWRQQAMRAAREVAQREPERVIELRRRIEMYRAHLDEAGLSGVDLDRAWTLSTAVPRVGAATAGLVLGLPLALWGIACHAIPYALVAAAVRWLDRTSEEEATAKMAAGLVLYPLFWCVEGWLSWRVAGAMGLAVFAVLLVPSGLVALAWRKRLGALGRQLQAVVRLLGNRRLHEDLRAERAALVQELTRLAATVREP